MISGFGHVNIVWRREKRKRQFVLRVKEKDELEVAVETGNADSNFSSARRTIIDYVKARMKVE